MPKVRIAALALLATLASCASAPEGDALTPAEKAAYEECLRQNQMVATAWEMIERQCLEEVRRGSSDASSPESFDRFDWVGEYREFQRLAAAEDHARAAALGDSFVDRAAMDLNYANPEFGMLAEELAASHERAGNLERAALLFNQAAAAFTYSQGFATREATVATGRVAGVELARGDVDLAVSLYEEALSMAAIGGHAGEIGWLANGLARAYDRRDPRISADIREAAGRSDL